MTNCHAAVAMSYTVFTPSLW